MDKRIWMAIAVVVLSGAGLWLYTLSGSTSVEPSITSIVATTTVSDQSVSVAKTLTTTGMKNSTTYQSLLTQSGSYECDYSQTQADAQSSNVIYIYGGKLRAEFRTSSAGVTNANFMVYDGHYVYQWHEGAKTGTKTTLTSLSQLPFVIPKDLTSGAIYGTSYESVGWLCHVWLTDKALLTPPSYVAFSSSL